MMSLFPPCRFPLPAPYPCLRRECAELSAADVLSPLPSPCPCTPPCLLRECADLSAAEARQAPADSDGPRPGLHLVVLGHVDAGAGQRFDAFDVGEGQRFDAFDVGEGQRFDFSDVGEGQRCCAGDVGERPKCYVGDVGDVGERGACWGTLLQARGKVAVHFGNGSLQLAAASCGDSDQTVREFLLYLLTPPLFLEPLFFRQEHAVV